MRTRSRRFTSCTGCCATCGWSGTGRRVVATASGRGLHNDPSALLEALARDLLAGDSFRAACAELAVALIVDGAIADYGDALSERIQPATAAAGWQSDGDSPGVRDVGWAIAEFLRPAEAIGLLTRSEPRPRRSLEPLRLTTAGRSALIAGLRDRALAPATATS